MNTERLVTNISAVILEDEPLVARDLQNLLHKTSSGITILATLDSLKAAKEWFLQHPEPDVVFCDIQLSDGVSFDLFAHAPITCPVIFTTAYDDYALRAFKLNSIDYLLKPVDSEELAAALGKLQRWRTSVNLADAKHLLQSQMQSMLRDMLQVRGVIPQPPHRKDRFKERFLVHAKGGMVLVGVAHVAYFHKDELIYLGTTDGKRFLTDYESVEEVEELLNPALFFRANRKTLLHIHAIDGFKAELSGKLTLALKAPAQLHVDVSREKASAFKKWLGGEEKDEG
jgi:DNA-binding LytR/AlgR family response regulator